ncbi:MAG: Smr/MutS family protein [Flavobacteriales bacterium]|nr:Smr/MutS family protein [Flavobacteriales bacterium]
MKEQLGNKVKFINENLEGKIIMIFPNGDLLVDCNDGFEHRVSKSEVVIVAEDNSIQYDVNPQEVKDKIKNKQLADKTSLGILNRYTSTTKYQYEKVIEIDLHLEELVEFPMKLDDWQRLHTQMQHVKKCLNAAINQKVRRLVFIHGVGTGVLKMELRNYLSSFDDISFKDADYREYGSGATEVLIKY